MKTLLVGNSESFNATQRQLDKHGSSYTVRSRGLSKIITLDDAGKSNMKFYDNKVPSAFLCGMVKRDIDKFIELHGIPKVYNKFYNTQYVNVNSISKVIGIPVYCIDLDYCYFQTAFNLGYISEKTFKRATANGNHKLLKDGMLAAIGGLNSLDFYEEYKNGKKIKEWADNDKYNRYSPFYWNIISKVWYLMEDCKELLGDDMYMWLTDCCYTSDKRKDDVYSLFKKSGYGHKHFIADFERVDEKSRMVYWFDTKANRTKCIPYTN